MPRSLDGEPPELDAAGETFPLVPGSRVLPVLAGRVLQHHGGQAGQVVEAHLLANRVRQLARLLVQVGEPATTLLGQDDLVVVPELVPDEGEAASNTNESLDVSKVNPGLSEPGQVEEQLGDGLRDRGKEVLLSRLLLGILPLFSFTSDYFLPPWLNLSKACLPPKLNL